MSSPRILAVGYNAWDVIVPVDGLPAPDTKTDVAGIHMGGGGPAATAAVAMRRLGAAVTLVTPLAGDRCGRWQAEELAREGVDLSLCPRLEDQASPLAVILADPGTQERTVLAARGGLQPLRPGSIPLAALDSCDLLYCDGHENAACVPLAREAGRRGLPVVMDAGSVRPLAGELVAACTDVISSRVFAPALTGIDDPAKALAALRRMGVRRAGMTFGPGGVLGLDGSGPLAVPAFAVEVVDTTGAGDAFHAGYAFALASGRPFGDCLEFGCAVAALKCTRWGGRQGLPDQDSVAKLIAAGPRLPLDPLIGAHLS